MNFQLNPSGSDCSELTVSPYLSPKVWAMADSKRQGFLGLTEFITAMQVVY